METNNNILDTEEELHRQNADLELRTRRMLEDVQKTVSRQSTPSLWSFASTIDIYNEDDSIAGHQRNTRCSRAKSACSRVKRSSSGWRRPLTPERFFSRKELEGDDPLPPGSKNMSAESQVRFLKAKCKILQEDITAGKREYSIRTEEWRKVQNELKMSEDERVKLSAELLQVREKLRKQESATTSALSKLTMRDNEVAILKREVEMLKMDLRKSVISTSANDTRMNKLKSELDQMKEQLKMSQLNEKEAKEKSRATEEEMYLSVRKLERQKGELLGAIKKQIYLIDNLKAAKGYTDLDGLAKLSERDLLALLDWKPPPTINSSI
ncbi:Hypothetical protein NTJ_01696 [Nesidiocoris tenuis]|uniref:Uncharacterized protein n=1 Tax=Nesidiocoris tenuis TaxID=355587 RepID=A0ABN7ACJ6_9HEMI|nr:Hypothetical protein NTJ_01696 [Nesidiocoris tenuis]